MCISLGNILTMTTTSYAFVIFIHTEVIKLASSTLLKCYGETTGIRAEREILAPVAYIKKKHPPYLAFPSIANHADRTPGQARATGFSAPTTSHPRHIWGKCH
jgi:hypothetical protein